MRATARAGTSGLDYASLPALPALRTTSLLLCVPKLCGPSQLYASRHPLVEGMVEGTISSGRIMQPTGTIAREVG